MSKKCATYTCENFDNAEEFVGNLCVPCHIYYSKILKEVDTECSQAYRNQLEKSKKYLKNAEIYIIEQRYI